MEVHIYMFTYIQCSILIRINVALFLLMFAAISIVPLNQSLQCRKYAMLMSVALEGFVPQNTKKKDKI